MKFQRGKRSLLPTPAEMRLLRALWSLETASVDEIVKSFSEKAQPHYKTTHTLLRIMESKKFVRHVTIGKTFVFEPIVTQQEIGAAMVRRLLKNTFGESANQLFVNLLETASLKPGDLEEMERLIREHRQSRKVKGDAI